MVPAAQANPLDIASALAQQKLKGAPTNPGYTLRQNAGSDIEENFSALLRQGGKDPSQVLKPLEVSDKLQAFKNSAGSYVLPRMTMGQAIIRPFRTADMMLTQRRESGVQEEIATLLARNDPKIIRQLQEIAMFDPNVRRALSAAGMFGPQLSQPLE
jgi:hypothetical protein